MGWVGGGGFEIPRGASEWEGAGGVNGEVGWETCTALPQIPHCRSE